MNEATQVVTLTDFLLARIAEDEATAREYALGAYSMVGEAVDAHAEVLGEDRAAARVLAECEAKRAIVNYFRVMRENAEQFDALRLSDADAVLTMLATVYADHPDYRDEWRP